MHKSKIGSCEYKNCLKASKILKEIWILENYNYDNSEMYQENIIFQLKIK